jgi:hypothetical protein
MVGYVWPTFMVGQIISTLGISDRRCEKQIAPLLRLSWIEGFDLTQGIVAGTAANREECVRQRA